MVGRGISPGQAEGETTVLDKPFSFLGGVEPATGRLTVEGRTDSISDRVLVFPSGRGSTVGSYVILDMKRNGTAPSAIVNSTAEPIVATGAVMSGVPMVDGVDLSLIRDGDRISVDGDVGVVELPDMREVKAVVCLLWNGSQALLVKRSDPNPCGMNWAGILGTLKGGEEPLKAARRAIEESGMIPHKLIRTGKLIRKRREDTVWDLSPLLFDAGRKGVGERETVDHRWIAPSEIADFDGESGLEQVFRSLDLL